MADFTAKDVQNLRQLTGAGMMDAKKALVENDGDAEAAAQWLREKGYSEKRQPFGSREQRGSRRSTSRRPKRCHRRVEVRN